MTSAEPDRKIIRQQLTRALGHDLDETSWQALRALRPQVPTQGTIYFRPIHSHSVDAPDTRPLCGGPLPASGRFRCDPCAIAAQLVLGQPILSRPALS